MARPYSQDLRERMMWAVVSGQSRHEVARMFDVSASCVIKLMQRVDATGDCQPRKFGGHKRYALAEHEDTVRGLVLAKRSTRIFTTCRQKRLLKCRQPLDRSKKRSTRLKPIINSFSMDMFLRRTWTHLNDPVPTVNSIRLAYSRESGVGGRKISSRALPGLPRSEKDDATIRNNSLNQCITTLLNLMT